ncbi:MAG TPA: hypothetical protein VNS60_09755 [Solirubrobacterales bacterium]|nr:hypothetical protein [Solirubrobacterales bacterium]
MAETEELTQAVKEAKEAAAKAERAAALPKYWLIVGILFALVGAVMAFALKDSDTSALGVELQPLGGVLLAAGALLLGAAAVGSMGDGNGGGGDSETIRRLGGLIAVVVGITAVTALAIVTLTQLGHGQKDSIVAVTSSAFGIISAVVGAYLGIKITGDTSDKAVKEVKNAAVAEHQAHVAQREVAQIKETAKETMRPEDVEAIDAAANEVREEEAARISRPTAGGQAV